MGFTEVVGERVASAPAAAVEVSEEVVEEEEGGKVAPAEGVWARASAREMVQGIRSGRVTSAGLVELFLGRIEAFNARLGRPVVVLDAEGARAAARAADARVADGKMFDLGILHGVPMTVKESNNVRGLPTYRGSAAREAEGASGESHSATEDSFAVAKLRRAGAVVLGKTAVPEGLADWQTYSATYGGHAACNPWDVGRTPGGSSGGSSAALAAGMTPLELGSDIGGSVRHPAHYCGVWGHKPTWGLVSTRGARPGMRDEVPPDMSVVGPMARCPEDLTLAMDALVDGGGDWSAADRPDAYSVTLPRLPRYHLAHLRVAVWRSEPGVCDRISADVRRALDDVVSALRRAGARVDEVARPRGFSGAAMHAIYLDLLCASVNAHASDADLEAARARADAHAEANGGDRGLWGKICGMSARELARTQAERWRLKKAWEDFFAGRDVDAPWDPPFDVRPSQRGYDCVLAPVGITAAFPHAPTDDRYPFFVPSARTLDVDGEPVPYTDNLFFAGLASCSGLPATAFPVRLAEPGPGPPADAQVADGDASGPLPVGLQLIGAAWHDYALIQAATLVSAALVPHQGDEVPPGRPRDAFDVMRAHTQRFVPPGFD